MFAVTYALLLKSKVMGEDQKIIGVVSLVVAFFVIGYGGVALGMFMQTLFWLATIVIAGLLVTVLFVTMAGGDITKLMERKEVVALIAAIGLVVFFVSIGSIGVNIGSEVFSAIFVVIIMGIAVFFIASGGK